MPVVADEIKAVARVAGLCAQHYQTHFFGSQLFVGYTAPSAWVAEAVRAAGISPSACLQIERQIKEYHDR